MSSGEIPAPEIGRDPSQKTGIDPDFKKSRSTHYQP